MSAALYSATGHLAGVKVFLVWLWISNLAILLGLEFDAELARERAVEGGLPLAGNRMSNPRHLLLAQTPSPGRQTPGHRP